MLAIISRKLKVKVVNESKELAINIYTMTTLLLGLGIYGLAAPNQLILNEILFDFGIILIATVYLILLFVPKVSNLLFNHI